MESIERLRKDADMCTQMAGTENKFETVWIVKDALLKDIDAIEREVEERYIELPKDESGDVWHVGDLVVGEVNPNNQKRVERMLWYGPDSGWQLETDSIIYPCPERLRHYHAPTVEDVLNELCTKAFHSREIGANVSYKDVIAEYAAKLQLKED